MAFCSTCSLTLQDHVANVSNKRHSCLLNLLLTADLFRTHPQSATLVWSLILWLWKVSRSIVSTLQFWLYVILFFKNKSLSLYLLLTVVCLDLLPLRYSWWRRGRRGVQVWRPSWRRVDAATGRHHQERALHWRGWMDGGRPQRKKGAVSWQLCQGEVEQFVFPELLNAEKCRFVMTRELSKNMAAVHRQTDRQTE